MGDTGSISFDALAAIAEKLSSKRDRLKQQLEDIDRELNAIEITLEVLKKNKLMDVQEDTELVELSPEELKGKSQTDALVLIAQRNKGVLRVRSAKDFLVRAGLLKDPKHAAASIYTALSRTDRFEKESSGVYRLKATTEKMPVEVQQSLPVTAPEIVRKAGLSPMIVTHKGLVINAHATEMEGGWAPAVIIRSVDGSELRRLTRNQAMATGEEARDAALKGAILWIDNLTAEQRAALLKDAKDQPVAKQG